jgi:hypothetical protein
MATPRKSTTKRRTSTERTAARAELKPGKPQRLGHSPAKVGPTKRSRPKHRVLRPEADPRAILERQAVQHGRPQAPRNERNRPKAGRKSR